MENDIFELLKDAGVRGGVLMADYTSFRVGGPAFAFIEPKNTDELALTLSAANACGIDYFVMGNGTDLLVSDSGVNALVIRIGEGFSSIACSGCTLTAGAGALITQAAKLSLNSGLMGFEWAAGIPGSVGGAVAMNAGAYGGEISDVLTSITYMKDGRLITETPPPGSLGYRTSAYSAPDRIVIEAEFTLNKDDGGARGRAEEYARRRREKQPLNYPSAGSVFKRPEGHYAGALIEQAGLKGYSIGGAQVSCLHAGFIVNTSGATAADIYSLIQLVKCRVFESSGIMLEPEVKLVGDFSGEQGGKECIF